MKPILNLLVLRTSNLDSSIKFYTMLGIEFARHHHGRGPEHYAAELGPFVFEIYPSPSKDSDSNVGRLGFQVEKLDDLYALLVQEGVSVVSAPQSSEWGYQAVVLDPNGQKVELTQARSR